MRTYLAAVAVFCFTILARAEVWQATGKASLVELYTSEGCSSCPPADRWLSGLKTKPGLWKDFVPVAFHVNYWDSLGWPDKFADPDYTQRQRNYATLWKSSTVYTPAVVVQGASGERSESFKSAPESLSARLQQNELELTTTVRGKAIVHAAWLAMDVLTDVKRGENAGEKLRHDFIVVNHQVLGPLEANKKWKLNRPLSPAAPVQALAVWLEVNQRPVVATGGYLNEKSSR